MVAGVVTVVVDRPFDTYTTARTGIFGVRVARTVIVAGLVEQPEGPADANVAAVLDGHPGCL